MPRIGRIVVAGIPHHITQRGNNKQDVFFIDSDRKSYIEILKIQSHEYGLKIHGYCLMSNHVHIIATPKEVDSIAKTIGRTHHIYAQHINRLHGRTGHLWHSRFFSCILDERHFLEAIRYIENNPVRSRLCEKSWEYEWSSAQDHIGIKRKLMITDISEWDDKIGKDNWKILLNEKIDEEKIKSIKCHTRTGRPLGSDSFLSKIEVQIGYRLRAFPVGRPKKFLLNV